MAKVFVGMSGGVDSSVTAALLKEQGHDVRGVFMKNWTRDIGGVICPWRKDLSDAKRVAVQLDIPFEVFDFEKQYKQQVVDYMLAEIKRGRTPNPDVMCNQEVKFKLFLETAIAHGAEAIATGHYARIDETKDRQFQLKRGLDEGKDQSYFLYRVSEEALAKSLMPLGGMTKPQVRALAKKYGLATADKPDSVGICFVGEVGIDSFVEEFLGIAPGDIISRDGQKLGSHRGAELYTIGQRHGLGLGGGLPYYVVGTDVEANTVTVTTDLDDAKLWRKKFAIADIHWINGQPAWDKPYDVQIRYRSRPVKGRLAKSGKMVKIELDQPAKAVTPGQSAVIYDGDRVLGGGIIV